MPHLSVHNLKRNSVESNPSNNLAKCEPDRTIRSLDTAQRSCRNRAASAISAKKSKSKIYYFGQDDPPSSAWLARAPAFPDLFH